MAATSLAISGASAEILIVHGRLCPETDSRQREHEYWMKRAHVNYEIIKIGRGVLNPNISNIYHDENGRVASSNAIPVTFYLSTGQDPIPHNAILILDNGFWEQFNPQHSYRVLGEESWRGIVPYTPEAWEAILKRSNEELAEVPPADRLPQEEVYAVAASTLMGTGVAEQDIYFWALRRIPFQWIVNACFLKDGQLYDYSATLNDRGDILDESEPKLNRYYRSGEKIDAFFSREHPDRRSYRRYDIPTAPHREM